MNQITITKLKNNSVRLPKNAVKSWRNAQVVLSVSDETIILKRVAKPNFFETWRKLKKVGRMISQKDIDNAVKWARAKTYQGRS